MQFHFLRGMNLGGRLMVNGVSLAAGETLTVGEDGLVTTMTPGAGGEGLTEAALLSESEAGRLARSLGTGDWRTSLASGLYAVTYTQAQHTTFGMPTAGVPDADTFWLLEVVRTGALTGAVRATGYYTHLLEATARQHVFVAHLTLASGAATSWTVGAWQGVSPSVLGARVVQPEALSIFDWTLAKPAALTETFPILPKRTQAGFFGTTTVRALRPDPTGTTYYVDGVNGSNANDGLTTSTPLKTIASALGKTTPGRILIAPAVYRYADGPQALITGLGASVQIHLERWPIRPGRVWITTGHGLNTFTSLGGGTPAVYTTPAQFLIGLVDFGTLDEHGFPVKYVEVANAAACQLVPGSWYDAGGNTVGFHPLSGTPSGAIVPMRNHQAISVSGTQTVVLDGIDIVGGSAGVSFANNSGAHGGALWARACRFTSIEGSGVFVRGFEQAVLEDCKAHGCGGDGFYYIWWDANAATKRVVEIRCKANGNGYRSGIDTGNGSTAHNGVQIIRIDCAYEQNVGPQVADVLGAINWNVGVYAGPSAALDGDLQHCGFQTLDDSVSYYYECASASNFADLVVGTQSEAYIDRCEFSELSEPIGTRIFAYDQV